jgi:hypothetical protein
LEVLLVKVLLETVAVSARMAPPMTALLLVKVLEVTVFVVEKMAPP